MKNWILLATAIFAVASCGDSIGPDTVPVTGAYRLETINGESLPLKQGLSDGYQSQLISGSLSLNADMTSSVVLQYRLSAGDQVEFASDVKSGSYTTSNKGGFRMTWTSPGRFGSFDGTLRGGKLTSYQGQSILVYRK